MRTRHSRRVAQQGETSPLAMLQAPTRKRKAVPRAAQPAAPVAASPVVPSSKKRTHESSLDSSLDASAQSATKRARLNSSEKPSPKHLFFATERVSRDDAPTPTPARLDTPPASNILDGDESTFVPEDASTPAPTPATLTLLAPPLSALPVTNTTVAEDFAGLLQSRLTPRPYALKYAMSGPRRPTHEPERKSTQKPRREKDLFEMSDDEEEDESHDDEKSLPEQEYPKATARQLKENERLLHAVNKTYLEHQRSMEAYNAKGLGRNHKKDSRNAPASQPKLVINIVQEVEKFIEVPGPSMPAEFPQNTLVIPASLEGEQMLLTDPRLIEMARAAAVFLTHDTKHQLPTSSQMTELLQRFNETGAVDSLVSDNPSANPFDSLVTNRQVSLDHDNLPAGSESRHGVCYDENNNEQLLEMAMSNALGVHVEQPSEVEGPASSPFIATPAQHPSNAPVAADATSDVNRGFFSSMKNILTSPMKKFGLLADSPHDSTHSTPTNGARMHDSTPTANAYTGGHTPATITRLGVTPSADIDFSPSDVRDPKSPTPFNKRVQHQRRLKLQQSSILKAQKSEAQRMQDEVDGDIHREEREKKRVGFTTRDEVRLFHPPSSQASTPSSHASTPSPLPLERPHSGTFSVPMNTLSESDFSDSDNSNVLNESMQDTSMPDYSQDGISQNIDSHTDESIATNAQSNASHVSGLPQSRIDSHSDESSTSQSRGMDNEPQNGGHQFDGSRSKNSHYDESTPIDSQTVGTPAASPSHQYKKCTDPYTGTMFKQPEWVQANLDAGRPALTLPAVSQHSVTTTSTPSAALPIAPSTPAIQNSGTYSVPDYPWSPEELEELDREEEAARALAEKQSEQAVPAPPRPANAVLPPPYDKYVPKKPSFLSFTENMSPMQVVEAEKENVVGGWDAADDAPSPMGENARDEALERNRAEIIQGMSRRVLDLFDDMGNDDVVAA